MKKQLIYFAIATLLSLQGLSSTVTASGTTSALKTAVNKYKAGNYTGCMQDCLNITYHDSKNAVAYYYLAMSYAQTGQKDKAIAAYGKTLTLSPDALLADYASTGKRCLETPDKCEPGADSATTTPAATTTATGATTPDKPVTNGEELDKFIANPQGGLSSSVKKDLEQQQLDNLKNRINSGQDLDDNSMKLLNDASRQTTPVTKPQDETANNKPTEEQVAAAMKTLNEAGINPYSQVSNYQNPQAMQLQMLQSLNNNPVANSNDNSAMLNMIPMMIQQSKTGQGNYSPQLMQAFIMNSLTGNMDMDFGKNENDNDNN